MLVEVDGVGAHEEDDWVGWHCQIGDAVVRFNGHVGRCLVTSRHPETGEVDLPTLDILREYRGEIARPSRCRSGSTARCVQEGTVRVGDPVAASRVGSAAHEPRDASASR